MSPRNNNSLLIKALKLQRFYSLLLKRIEPTINAHFHVPRCMFLTPYLHQTQVCDMDRLKRRLRDKHLLTAKLLQRLESLSRFMEALLGPDAGDQSFEHRRDLTPSQVGALRGQLDETRQLVSFLSMTLDGQWS